MKWCYPVLTGECRVGRQVTKDFSMNSFQTERFSGHYYVYGMAGEVSVILFRYKTCEVKMAFLVGLLKVFLSNLNLPILSIIFCDKDQS